jgi:GT2 family glycosyltransferase
VIIPHYNDVEALDACLAALACQTFSAGRFEIVVADNGSPIGESAVEAAVAGRARLVFVSQRGAGPARNHGVAVSNGRVLAFTDADCVPGPEWIAEGVAMLEHGDIVGGGMRVALPQGRSISGAEAFEGVFAFDNRTYVNRKGFSVTANLFCSRALFDAVGPFRVDVSEDVEWCQRARSKGYTIVYADAASVAHPARRDWPELKRKWQRMNAENFALACSRPFGRLRWLVRNLLIPASIIVDAPRVLHSSTLPDARARVAALGTLARLRLWRSANAIALMFERRT